MSDNYGITGNVRATNLKVDGRAAQDMRETIRQEIAAEIADRVSSCYMGAHVNANEIVRLNRREFGAS